MPSWELFDALPRADRDEVLPPSIVARLAVEAGTPQVGAATSAIADVIGVDRFGASAPEPATIREYGFTVAEVCRRARKLIR
jgi:transketolase